MSLRGLDALLDLIDVSGVYFQLPSLVELELHESGGVDYCTASLFVGKEPCEVVSGHHSNDAVVVEMFDNGLTLLSNRMCSCPNW